MDAGAALASSGTALGSVAAGRGEDHAGEGPGGQVQPPVLARGVGVEPGVRVVEEERSSPFTLKMPRRRRLVGEHAGREQAVEQEGGVAGLGGHPGDAGDVDVGAASPSRNSRLT